MQILSKDSLGKASSVLAYTSAQVAYHSDTTGFHAACSDLTTFSFDGFDPNGCDGDFTEYPDGLTVQGVHFTLATRPDFPTVLFVHTPDRHSVSGKDGLPLSERSFLYANGAEALNVALPAGTTAFGADFLDLAADPEAAVTARINGAVFSLMSPDHTPSRTFAGFTSRIPITRLTLSGGDFGPILAGMAYGQAKTDACLHEPPAW